MLLLAGNALPRPTKEDLKRIQKEAADAQLTEQETQDRKRAAAPAPAATRGRSRAERKKQLPCTGSELPTGEGAATGTSASAAATPLLPSAAAELANVPSATERPAPTRRGRPRKSSIDAAPCADASDTPVKRRGRPRKNAAPTTPPCAGTADEAGSTPAQGQEQAVVSTPIPVRLARNPRKRVLRHPPGASPLSAAMPSSSDSEPDASHSTSNSDSEDDSELAHYVRAAASGSNGRGVQKKRARLDTARLPPK